MESNQQVINQAVSHLGVSNVFSKSVHSRLYESFHLQNSTSLTQDQARVYDSAYRSGFPKLYSFDTSVQNKSRISLDGKSKYSFRNDYSKITEENSILIRQNSFLRDQVNRLNILIQNQRRNAVSRAELDRLNSLLIQRDTEIRSLNQRIFTLQNKSSQTNYWELRYNQSQTTINQLNQRITSITQQYESQMSQLNIRITTLTQQISQYQNQFNQLNITINQYKQQISQLTIQINEYQTRISTLERQQRPQQQKDPQVDILRNQIYSLTTKIEQYELQISQYEKTFAQYQVQITTLQQVNWKLQEKVNRETKEINVPAPVPLPVPAPVQAPVIDNEQAIVAEGKLNFRIIILLEQINRLRQREQQLLVKAEQLHAYLLKAENYIEQIQSQLQKNNLKQNIPAHIVEKVTILEQQNNRYTLLIQELQSRLETTQVSGISEDEYHSIVGERDLRIIILLEEINRLNQKILQVRQYLVNAEDYIEQLQKALQERQPIIPAEVQTQLTYLSEQNHRLNLLIENYINQIKHLRVNIQAPSLPKIEYQIPAEVQTRLAFLAQQNQRLSKLVIELQNRPARVQTKTQYKVQYKVPADIEAKILSFTQENTRLTKLIVQLQSKPAQVSQTIDTTLLEEQYAKAKFRTIVLLEEINRLNQSLKQVSEYLVNAENFIYQLEHRQVEQIHTIEKVTTKVEVIPEWIESQMAKMTLQKIFLLQEINRLNHAAQQIHGHLINAEGYIEQCEIRLTELSQHTQVQQIFEYRNSPQIETKLGLLAQQNERLINLIHEIQNRPARVQTRVEQKVQFKIPAEVQNRISLLATENQRLELALNEVRQHLVNAENYIYELENKPQPTGIPIEIEEQIHSLTQQNQKLHAEINRLSLHYEQQIAQYKTEISTINIQLSTFRSEVTTYKSRISELERVSSSSSLSVQLQQQLESKWAAEHLRAIILLEEINRLNQKCADIDRERVEVIGHLVNAENYIQELEIKTTQLQEFNAKQSTITNTTVISGSNSAIQELNVQIIELESIRRLEVAARDLRIIFLLEEINRLNQKEKQLLLSQGQGASNEALISLQRQNEQCQQQLQQVLGHLRQAEQYIGQLLRENEGFAIERDQLIQELNNRR